MVSEVTIPVMDQTGGDFVLAKWLKHEGDPVRAGDVLCEVETSKSIVEIPADVGGVLRQILIPEGSTLASLTVIALIAEAHEPLPVVDPYHRLKGRAGATPTAGPATAVTGNRPLGGGEAREREFIASPRAKKLAAEHHLDLASIAGSGPGGRIVEEDVRKAIEAR